MPRNDTLNANAPKGGDMTAFAIFIVLIGLMGLLASLIPTYQICQLKPPQTQGWHLLLFMIGMFIFGYLGFLWMLLNRETGPLETVVSLVFSAGGAFVWLVVKMSMKTIVKLQDTLEDKHYQAYHDSLTDLPNRHMLYETMERLIKENGSPFGFIMMDLNDFKMINDNLGHDAGDKVLEIIAYRIERIMPPQALPVRLGGDEFAVLLPKSELGQAQRLAKQIQKAVIEDIHCEGHLLAVGISIGIALYPQDGDDRKTLMKHADIAMYRSKQNNSDYETFSQVTDMPAPLGQFSP
ncbi:diguanylate cyclase domain-containing protein [Shewanella loihica]|uniref:Diguanylate cyclase n=2 Tax=Shewanella TaxID=22 RepID=A3Q9K9_SHELP|nr:diguanylate cyclase [Shewanella loihica]ABO22157.1 diguanylate cyclase [Shewanella loihica PV-4]